MNINQNNFNKQIEKTEQLKNCTFERKKNSEKG